MSDADGDSTMHSSPELGASDDAMFPDEAAGPSTPRNAAALDLQLDAASELSPPSSQGPSNLNLPRDDSLSAALSGSPSLNQNGKRVLAPTPLGAGAVAGNGQLHTDPETGYQWSKPEEQPGWEWKNARVREDEARAWDQISDKGAMIRTRYGDPLDPTVPAKRR